MAAALFGGAFLSGAVQLLFAKLAPDGTIWNYFQARKSITYNLLLKLKTTLILVSKVLDDAEEKEISDSHVKEWLDELKDVVYDADDLLAEISFDSNAIAIESGSADARDASSKSSVSLDVLSEKENKFKEKLENILERLDPLMEVMKPLGLAIGPGVGRPLTPERETTSLVDEADVLGRNTDKEAITRLLKSHETKSINGLGIIAIVGMGGLGKTTLAQVIYEQKEISKYFQSKAWVCVSENDISLVTKNILKEFAPQLPDIDSMTLNRLQNELKKALTGKRFLLVLDDVWEERQENLDMLMRPLKYGSKGSWIIVTTRSNEVASLTSNVPPYSLKLLTEDESWSVFARCAFKNEDPNAYPDVVSIGKQIATKCGGLPLAANSLGCLLTTKRDTSTWQRVMESDLWNLKDRRILPALRLSYQWLPSRLKRCFAYCALFPKDYQFDTNKLVGLWMADDIFGSHEANEPMEDIGVDCFDALRSRSFFQRSSMNASKFVMHDLIHDLAKSVAGDFYYFVEDGNQSSPSRKPRHLSYLSTNCFIPKKIQGICRNQSLRSFLPIHLDRRDHYIGKDVVQHLLDASKCLRQLSLPGYINIKEVPESIINLKLLRYLDLSGTSITRLGDAICTLWNLETLLLEDCRCLTEISDSIVGLKNLHFLNLSRTLIKQLPINLCNLVKLCFLDISGTKLQAMPSKLGNLTRLQTLTDFFVGDENSCSNSNIKELKWLSKLKGTLRIWDLQNVHNIQDASESNLKGKKYLKNLKLMWQGDDVNDASLELKLLEGLEPPCTLEALVIGGYRGISFPEWVGHRSFSNLVSFMINKCFNCFEMPPLGQLDSLKMLEISGCDSIVVIGSSFYGNHVMTTNKPFKSLKVLRFVSMPLWERWEQQDGAFPCLEELHITNCPRLVDAFPCELPSLKKLCINGCVQLVTPISSAPPAVVEVRFEDDKCAVDLEPSSSLSVNGKKSLSLMSLDQMLRDFRWMGASISGLKKLSIKCCDLTSCSLLEGVLQHLECLDSLTIYECPTLVSFPKGELASSSLTKIRLRRLENLKSLPEQMKSIFPLLIELELDRCPELESFPLGGLPSKLETLKITHCKKLVAGRMQWNLQGLPSLSSLRVEGYSFDEDKESFPEPMLFPCTLTTLSLDYLRGLKSLDCRGLQHLRALQTLRIWSCRNLEKLPEEEGLTQSLTTLEIRELRNLKSLSPIERLTSLKRLNIWNCCSTSQVLLLPSTITHLELGLLKTTSLDGWGLARLTCLEELRIDSCEDLEFITEEAFPSSLREVRLCYCPMLRYITREDLPHLERLVILNCRMLKEKYVGEGEEWNRISHIPHIGIL